MKLTRFIAVSMRRAPESVLNAKPESDEGWRRIAEEVWSRGGAPSEVADLWWAAKRERARTKVAPPEEAKTPPKEKDPRAFFVLVYDDDRKPLARAPKPLDDELFPARSLITGTKARPPLQAKSEWPCRYCKKTTQSSDRACRRPACERSRESQRVE